VCFVPEATSLVARPAVPQARDGRFETGMKPVYLYIFWTFFEPKTKSKPSQVFNFFLIDQKMRNLVLSLPVLLRNG
jgi:hypothetical protein